MTSANDLSAGLFARGLINLKAQLTKAEAHAAASGTGAAGLLGARASDGHVPQGASYAPNDLHAYTLAAHVHWAAEGARLAIARLLGAPAVPAPNGAASFADLHAHLDTTLAYLRDVDQGALAAALDSEVVSRNRLGTTSSRGDRFLLAFAIPHFFYHLTTAYGIMRNQGVPLTMGDFLGDWTAG